MLTGTVEMDETYIGGKLRLVPRPCGGRAPEGSAKSS